MGVEDQQIGLLRTGGVLPSQLPAGDGRDIGQAGVPWVNVHEVTDVFAHQQATEVLMQLRGQPALAAGFQQGAQLCVQVEIGNRREAERRVGGRGTLGTQRAIGQLVWGAWLGWL